jgi:hypothetical protein
LRGRLGWGVSQSVEMTACRATLSMLREPQDLKIALYDTPHPNLPLKGGGDNQGRD